MGFESISANGGLVRPGGTRYPGISEPHRTLDLRQQLVAGSYVYPAEAMSDLKSNDRVWVSIPWIRKVCARLDSSGRSTAGALFSGVWEELWAITWRAKTDDDEHYVYAIALP